MAISAIPHGYPSTEKIQTNGCESMKGVKALIIQAPYETDLHNVIQIARAASIHAREGFDRREGVSFRWGR